MPWAEPYQRLILPVSLFRLRFDCVVAETVRLLLQGIREQTQVGSRLGQEDQHHLTAPVLGDEVDSRLEAEDLLRDDLEGVGESRETAPQLLKLPGSRRSLNHRFALVRRPHASPRRPREPRRRRAAAAPHPRGHAPPWTAGG